jgi:hypothetical protein
MKTILNLLLDGITFKDLAGKRQPRKFAVLGAAVLVLLFVLYVASGLERNAMMQEVRATPQPIAVTVEPSPTPKIIETQAIQAPPSGCPVNPADWSLADVFISKNYKLIQPTCVYDGLGKAVAWVMAVRSGYSRSEATRILGYTEMPVRLMEQASIPGDDNKPVDAKLFTTALHPDFSEWHVDSNGQASLGYGFRGCFRSQNVTGNKVETWGGDYPVICMIVEDVTGSQAVYALNGHVFTSPATPMRSFLLFGYIGEGQWVWLGARQDPQTPIDNPEKFANERLTYAALFDAPNWDRDWWKGQYQLEMKPLPDSWQAMTAETDKQYILSELNAYMNKVQP